MTVSPRPEWRRALYRFRHLIAAIAVLSGMLLVIRVFAPGTTTYGLASELPAGTVLTASDITEITVPSQALPDGHLPEPPIGERLLIDLPARTIITEHVISSQSLADRAPPGTLVFPIALGDPGSRALAQTGATVSLVAAEFDGAARVVDDVTVIAVYEPDTAGLFAAGEQGNAVALVAVRREHASFVLSASGSLPVRVAASSQ